MGKNDITWGEDNNTGMPPNQKANKAEELTYLSTNIEADWDGNFILMSNLSCDIWEEGCKVSVI